MSDRQLTLDGVAVALAELAHHQRSDYGEVFTRRWVVDLILDLVGYVPEKDLGRQVLVEPACGSGAFLVPVVERLIASSRSHGRDLHDLTSALRAYDLLEANALWARREVGRLLMDAGLTAEQAEELTAAWITSGDFLLSSHQPASADYVVGNPPYIRLENVPRRIVDAYRRTCPTMRGRADVYVGFIEKGLELLKPQGALSYICADRWMRNQYGAELRGLITGGYAVEAVIAMHEADAFEQEVSAYPAIFVFRRQPQRQAAVVEASSSFGPSDAKRVAAWMRQRRRRTQVTKSYEAMRIDGWFTGRDLWPAASPADLALIADLEARFPPLEDHRTGTRVGIGVATGCDEVFITRNADLVEPERLLPLLMASHTATGSTRWSGTFLVNPWNGRRLVDLESFPRLGAYLKENAEKLRARYVARKRPAAWYRTIDRVNPSLTERPKLVFPDLKATAHPVLDDGRFYPHHNLYYVVSETWDLEVLGGLLLSDVANLFVGSYCVKMRGGTYRFQAQYLRRIRVPSAGSIGSSERRELASAFADRDREKANHVARRVYGLPRGRAGKRP